MSGHDIKVLMKHYQQMDVRKKSMELGALPIGKTHYTETKHYRVLINEFKSRNESIWKQRLSIWCKCSWQPNWWQWWS